MKKTLLAVSALAALSSCSQQKADETTTSSLILYYSQTGATQQVAELLQKKVGADIESLQLVNPYSGDFGQTIARCQEEMSSGQLPELQPLAHNIADYDTIYIGYPVWFGTYAMPVSTLVKENSFAGKVIVPFCTFGSGGNTSVPQLAAALDGIKEMLPYYGVRNARVANADKELDAYLVAAGIVAGEAANVGEFGEQVPVGDAEKAIFDEACGSYQMPLGTPVSVSSRAIADGTEYLYTTETPIQDGDPQVAQIYVIKGSAEGSVAEFTQVIR